MCVALLSKWKLEQHAFFKLSGNLVQLKDGACEGKTLTGVRERQSFTGSVPIFKMFFQHLEALLIVRSKLFEC